LRARQFFGTANYSKHATRLLRCCCLLPFRAFEFAIGALMVWIWKSKPDASTLEAIVIFVS
jgi:hypothetical protein